MVDALKASDVGRAFGVTREQPEDELRPPLFLLRPTSQKLRRTGRANLALRQPRAEAQTR